MKYTRLLSYILMLIWKLIKSGITFNFITFCWFMFRREMNKTKALTQSLRIASLFLYCCTFEFIRLSFILLIGWWNVAYFMKRILTFSELRLSFLVVGCEILIVFYSHLLKKALLKGGMQIWFFKSIVILSLVTHYFHLIWIPR